MRRALSIATAAVLALGAASAITSPAEARTHRAGVTVNTLADRALVLQQTALVKPSYTTTGSLKVRKASLTVRQGSTTLAHGVGRVRVPAGTFTVTLSVAYQVRSKGHLGRRQVVKKVQTLTVAQACATLADYASVRTVEKASSSGAPSDQDFDTLAAAVEKLRSTGTVTESSTLGEIRAAAEARGDEQTVLVIDTFIVRYGTDGTYAVSQYPVCDSTKQIELTAIGGDTWFKRLVVELGIPIVIGG